MSQLSIREFLKKFNSGEFNNEHVSVQINAGWFDWFCNDGSLVNKTRTLAKKVAQIANSSKINQDKDYVSFKNHCPVCGSLYDSITIVDKTTGSIKYCVIPRDGHSGEDKGKAQVFAACDFYTPVVNGNWNDVKKYFNG